MKSTAKKRRGTDETALSAETSDLETARTKQNLVPAWFVAGTALFSISNNYFGISELASVRPVIDVLGQAASEFWAAQSGLFTYLVFFSIFLAMSPAPAKEDEVSGSDLRKMLVIGLTARFFGIVPGIGAWILFVSLLEPTGYSVATITSVLFGVVFLILPPSSLFPVILSRLQEREKTDDLAARLTFYTTLLYLALLLVLVIVGIVVSLQ